VWCKWNAAPNKADSPVSGFFGKVRGRAAEAQRWGTPVHVRMNKTFLFRFDGARENDEFLEHARSQGHLVYSGTEMKLTRGWIPDFIEVVLDDNLVACSLTIFELESTENVGRVSARKYLPESSHEILETFRQYLHRVLQRCRSTADPRARDIQQLDDALGHAAQTSIWTAAALRRPPRTVERLPLIDQGIALRNSPIESRTHYQTSSLRGELSLSAREHKTLSRTVLILDAVARGWDKSDASLRAWRGARSQPLRNDIRQNPSKFPTLSVLLLGQKTGVGVMIEDVARELCVIWSLFQPGHHSQATVLTALEKFLPIDRNLDPRVSVRKVFETARLVLDDGAAQPLGDNAPRG
jgi:hypothetical protein